MKKLLRSWNATWRDTLILLKEFRTPLFIFTVAVVGGGLIYYAIARGVGESDLARSPTEAIFIVLTAAFLQPSGEFPRHYGLQLFHFLMPVIGIIILAQGLADFGSLLFNRRARSKEWEMAVASTMKNHIVLVGLGHLGYRVAQHLNEMGKNIVVIELQADTHTVIAARAMGITVIEEDARNASALEGANIHAAQTIILASQNDAMNLQIALKARSLNPGIQVVIRIFDEDFAHALHDQFGFVAMSATEMAAPGVRSRGRRGGCDQPDLDRGTAAQPGAADDRAGFLPGTQNGWLRGGQLPSQCHPAAARSQLRDASLRFGPAQHRRYPGCIGRTGTAQQADARQSIMEPAR